jgi:hypothetical protein
MAQKTDEEINAEFRRLADTFIDLANRHAVSVARENVGMSLLYAAARFAAFVVSTHARSMDRYEADRERAIEFFCAEYRRMLAENLDDYRRVFDKAAKPAEPPSSH